MRIRGVCAMTYEFGQATLIIAILNAHPSRVPGLQRADGRITNPIRD